MQAFLKSIPWSKRLLLGSALFCGGLLFGAVVIEYTVKLIPCPLCIAQRVFFGLVGLTALVGYFGWSNRFGIRVIGSLMFFFSLLGGAIALRQVWMQHFPPAGFDPTKCAVSFGSFVDSFLQALGGAGNCAVRDFTLIGLALPEWSLLSFLGLLAVSFWLILRTEGSE
jgi:disulfide bond formation protein DsbB